VVVMNAGRIEQIGEPNELYHNPKTRFVAGFIGSPAMNLVAGETAESGVAVNGAALAVEGPGEPGRLLLVGLRPEHFELASDGPIALRLELLERLGADTILHGRLGGSGSMIRARVPGTTEAAVGEILRFSIRPERVHLFDRETGRRLNA